MYMSKNGFKILLDFKGRGNNIKPHMNKTIDPSHEVLLSKNRFTKNVSIINIPKFLTDLDSICYFYSLFKFCPHRCYKETETI